MENRTIRSTPLWRLIILVLTVAALAATVVNVARSWATPPSWPASCAGPMARNPDLPADDFTRDKLITDGVIRRGL